MLADIRARQVDRGAPGKAATVSEGPAGLQQPTETCEPDQRSNAGGHRVPEPALAAILLADDLMEPSRAAEESGDGRHQERVRRWRKHISSPQLANGRARNDG